MNKRIFATAVALILTMPATADLTAITEGYEVALSEIRLPRNAHGTIGFKPCETCDYETRRVSADAQWEINGNKLSLDKFREQVSNLGNQDAIPVTVTRRIESNQVTKVAVYVRDTDISARN